MGNSRYEVNIDGIYYDDIDWDKDLHSLGTHCPMCGNDGIEGHGSSCEYLFKSQQTPRGRDFLKNMIYEAIIREQKAGNPAFQEPVEHYERTHT